MTEIVELMKNQPDFYFMAGVSDEDIKLAEQKLGVQFAADYRQYLAAFGEASFDGHELTGICKSDRLNVVAVTCIERLANNMIQSQWYVIEQTGIDSITIWQSTEGEIYLCQGMCSPKRIAESLAEYLEL